MTGLSRDIVDAMKAFSSAAMGSSLATRVRQILMGVRSSIAFGHSCVVVMLPHCRELLISPQRDVLRRRVSITQVAREMCLPRH